MLTGKDWDTTILFKTLTARLVHHALHHGTSYASFIQRKHFPPNDNVYYNRERIWNRFKLDSFRFNTTYQFFWNTCLIFLHSLNNMFLINTPVPNCLGPYGKALMVFILHRWYCSISLVLYYPCNTALYFTTFVCRLQESLLIAHNGHNGKHK